MIQQAITRITTPRPRGSKSKQKSNSLNNVDGSVLQQMKIIGCGYNVFEQSKQHTLVLVFIQVRKLFVEYNHSFY